METETKGIALDLIDDPVLAMRSDLDDEDLEELKRSMTEMGLIEPIILRPVGERYEVIAGHRRTRAARLLNWPLIPALVRQATDDETFAIRLAENFARKDIDPVDEACFISEIILKHKKTPQDVAKLLHRSTAWVDERMTIFEMPEYLQTAIKQKKIPLGAAFWLNQIQPEQTRHYYVSYCVVNGVTVNAARRYYETLKASNFDLPASTVIEQGNSPEVQNVRMTTTCARCASALFLDEADSVLIHRSCPLLEEKSVSPA